MRNELTVRLALNFTINASLVLSHCVTTIFFLFAIVNYLREIIVTLLRDLFYLLIQLDGAADDTVNDQV